MKIARLEIVGFKSFAEKVTLNFGDGITSVVGPNGCGKSNIVDALRWVMGEQSAKHLRGRAMEDVIFNGSESRGPMGLSEVTLTLKNDGNVPSEYASYEEIAVRRRLFRDGQSEYSINKTPVRLKDITDLFLGTGAGTRAYSMIEQGRIGFIVNSKPEERRFLIEEVAGITKYKTRKKAAQRRMEATEQNLLRVNDIVTELGRQLGSLERQAQKAERYKKLKAELKELELWVASMRYLELYNAARFVTSLLGDKGQNESDLGTALLTAETGLEATRLDFANQEAENARRSEQVYGLDSRLKVLDRDLEFYAKERDSQTLRGSQAEEEAEALVRQRATLESEVEVLGDHAKSLGSESEKVLYELQEKEQTLRGLGDQRRNAEQEYEQLQKQMIAALTEVTKHRTQLENCERRKNDLTSEGEKLAAETAEVELNNHKQREIETLLVAELETLTANEIEGKQRLVALNEQLARHKQALAMAEARVLALKEQIGEKKSRLSSLGDIQKNYEGYGAGVRAIMTSPEANGLLGLVADVLSTDSAHEVALEALLGERLQYVIVESLERGVAAIDYLKAQAEGRGTFILRDAVAPEQTAVVNAAGIGARLLDQVVCQPGFEKVAQYLLGDVYLATDVDSAQQAYTQQPNGPSFVTLSGEVLHRGGVLTGGTATGLSSGLLKQKREIKELGEEVRQLENDLLLGEGEKLATAAIVVSTDAETKQTQETLHQTQIHKAKAERDLSAEKQNGERLKKRAGELAVRQSELSDKIVDLAEEADQHRQAMAAVHGRHAEKEQEAAALNERAQHIRELQQEAQEALTVLKVAFAQKDEKQKNVVRTLERLQQSLAETAERIIRAKDMARNGGQQSAALLVKIENGQVEREKLVAELMTLKATLSDSRVLTEQTAQKVRALEEEVKAKSKLVSALRDERSGLEMSLREHQLGMEHLLEGVAASYQLNLCFELTDYHHREAPPEDASQQIDGLKQQLSRMGDINLMAIDEFNNVKTRHDFLTTQRTDLERALSSLRNAILRINRTSRDRFQEAFDATNEMFQKVFPRLFRGGSASLQLIMDGTDDLLEAGIDILAQPPGKKVQSVQLLSGGEKALTAVSLVFSIFLIKPSPFCVLDEVDAPLDEGNVVRFNELLREISEVSQFIVITHNKGTMETADRLYGITMEEPGISKLVSVDLRRREDAAREQSSSSPS